jgi:hypothetical protein
MSDGLSAVLLAKWGDSQPAEVCYSDRKDTFPKTTHQKLFPWSMLENYNIGLDFLIGMEAGQRSSTSTYRVNKSTIDSRQET